ncbi:MAG: hypothetical protein AB8B60_11580 [Sulfitobacter sp.]
MRKALSLSRAQNQPFISALGQLYLVVLFPAAIAHQINNADGLPIRVVEKREALRALGADILFVGAPLTLNDRIQF